MPSHPLLSTLRQTTIMRLAWRTKIDSLWKMRNLFEILKNIFSKFLKPFWTCGCRWSYWFKKGPFSDNTCPRNTKLLASKYTNHVTRVDTHMIWQFIVSLTEVRKSHTHILDLSSWMTHWKRRRKSIDRNNTHQRLVCLAPWRWRSQNVACELRVVGRKTFWRVNV